MGAAKVMCRTCGEVFEDDSFIKADQERNQHEASCEPEENK